MADEGLIIKIFADAKDFVSGANKAVKDAKSKFKGLGDELVKELKRVDTVGTTAFKGIAGALGAVATGVGGLIAKGTAYNQNLEQQLKSLEILLGSTEKANKMLQELKDYDKISPFDLSQLTEAAKQMLAYGIESEKVVPLLKQFGDIAMGDQDKVNALALAFAQCSATGKLMGQDLNQMINAGFNPLEFIAKKTGKSVGELKEEMAKGAITVEMVEEAFKMATSEGERFYQATEKGSQTVQGRLSILEADFEAFCGQIAEGFTKTFGDEILPMAEGYMERISDAFSKGGFKGLITELGTILGELVDVIVQKLPDLIDAGIDIVKAILKGIMDNIFSITTAADALVTNLTEGIRKIMPRLLTIAKVIIGTILNGFIEYKTLIMEMGIQIITTLAEGLAEAAPELAPKMVDLVNGLIATLVENMPVFLESIITIVVEIANALWDKMDEISRNLYVLVKGICDEVLGSIGTWGPALLKVIGVLLEALLAIVMGILVSIFQNLGKWWNSSLKPWFDRVGDSIRNWFSGIGETVRTKVQDIRTSIVNKVNEIKTNIASKISEIKTNIASKITEIRTNIESKINEIKTNISTKINEIKTNISTKVSAIVTSVVDTIRGLPGKMLEIGTNIVQGIWDGISSAKEWLKEKIQGFISGIGDWFCSIGDWFGGLFGGGSSEDAGASMAQSFTKGVRNGLSAGMPNLSMTGPALSGMTQVSSVTNDNGNVFNFTNYITGTENTGEEIFRQFQRKVRYSGGVL